MTPPFTDALMPEVIARVAYEYVKLIYRQSEGKGEPGHAYIIAALAVLPFPETSLMRSALLAMLHANRNGCKGRSWVATAIALSRAGCGFRRCWYDDYKADRRANPRVTNRGVSPR